MYGILGETMDLDPNKTYDYHTAFDIQPTKVVYNVDLNMNRTKILNIALDKNCSNSAATVKMVSDLETKLGPYTKNSVYREIFEEFYDCSDASNYKLTLGASGITFIGINPNITFPQKTITNVQEGGLRLQNQTLDLTLFSKKSFTICVVMQLWLNRSHPRRPRGSQSGREKRREESFQERAKEPLGTDSHKFKRMPAPDWAQKKKLCIFVPNRRTHLLSFLVFSYMTAMSRSRLVCLMHQRNARSQETFSFDIKYPSDIKILSARKLKTLFQKYKLQLTTGIHACIGHVLRKYL